MKKLAVFALLLGALGGSAFAQTPSGAYSSPASGGGSGAQTPTSVTGTTAGVFTLAQQNDNFLFNTTGGGSQTAGSILNFGGTQTFKLTDGLASVINIPTSGVTNAFSNAYGAYCWNPNGNATGQFGWVGCVGYFSQVVAAASGARAWGANFGCADLASQTGNFVFCNEYDATINNNTTQGAGNLFSFRGNGQPTGNNFPAVRVQPPAGTGNFTSGFSTDDGGLPALSGSQLPYNAVNVGQQGSGNAQDAQFIWWNSHAGTTAFSYGMNLMQDGFFRITSLVSGTAGAVNFTLDGSNAGTGNNAGYGITLKSTAALSVNQLVKPDTGNADSVVICTTVDTTACMGFVSGGTTYCGAGSRFCSIITVPGSKAVGILGTGTCSIGNNVIVDTTTNGRIKCQVGIPVQGAWVGVAISAQATVGNTVDILTKFQ